MINLLSILFGMFGGAIVYYVLNELFMRKLSSKFEDIESKLEKLNSDINLQLDEDYTLLYRLSDSRWVWTRRWLNHLLVKNKLDEEVWVDPVEIKEDVQVSTFDIKEVSKDE